VADLTETEIEALEVSLRALEEQAARLKTLIGELRAAIAHYRGVEPEAEYEPATYEQVADWLESGHGVGVAGNRLIAARIREVFGSGGNRTPAPPREGLLSFFGDQ